MEFPALKGTFTGRIHDERPSGQRSSYPSPFLVCTAGHKNQFKREQKQAKEATLDLWISCVMISIRKGPSTPERTSMDDAEKTSAAVTWCVVGVVCLSIYIAAFTGLRWHGVLHRPQVRDWGTHIALLKMSPPISPWLRSLRPYARTVFYPALSIEGAIREQIENRL